MTSARTRSVAVALDLATGDELWRTLLGQAVVNASPAIEARSRVARVTTYDPFGGNEERDEYGSRFREYGAEVGPHQQQRDGRRHQESRDRVIHRRGVRNEAEIRQCHGDGEQYQRPAQMPAPAARFGPHSGGDDHHDDRGQREGLIGLDERGQLDGLRHMVANAAPMKTTAGVRVRGPRPSRLSWLY